MSEAAIEYDGPEDIEATEEVEDIEQEVEQEAPETPEQEVEAEEKAPEPVVFTPQQQEVFNREIGRKVAAQREIERKLQETQAQLEALQKQEPAAQVDQDGGPIVPEIPEMWDENYQQRMQQREEAIVARARWEDQQQRQQEEAQRIQQEQFQKQQEWIEQKREATIEKAKNLGVSESELQMAAEVVVGVMATDAHMPLILEIAEHEMGPLISTYLSQRGQELQAIAQMPPIRAWSHIEREIVPKLKRQMSRKESTPPPPETVEGTAGAKVDRGPKGAVYE